LVVITEKVVSLFSCGLFKTFVEEVMELVELNPLRDSLVGLPGSTGLSTEQRKRLTIAVELVANPSIFMDEPTSGLDARAAAIVMRTVRNTVDTGRTVVCTIHQPSIDIFEAFDEVMKPVYLALRSVMRSVILMLIRDLVFVYTLSVLGRICSLHRPF
jgi:ABC-type Mn2+/Zn2+ transport system ATPase subunit